MRMIRRGFAELEQKISWFSKGKRTYSDFCKIVFCHNQNKTSTILYHSMQDLPAFEMVHRTSKNIGFKIRRITDRFSSPPPPIRNDFSLRLTFRSEIFINEWSWRDMLLVKLSARLVKPNLISDPNKGYIWLSGKLTKVSYNTCYRVRAIYIYD